MVMGTHVAELVSLNSYEKSLGRKQGVPFHDPAA